MRRELPAVLDGYAALLATGDKAGMAALGRGDLFFLLAVLCGRTDMRRQWLLDRCDEVMLSPDGHLDLWAREHYKSTIITFGRTVQDILREPEGTTGIFSHTRPIAKGFLRQIKRELEANELLKALYPDVLWREPEREAPLWSEDGGLVVKRRTNPKEATVEAWGLVDGQPIGRHFRRLVYDDVVTRDNASSPEMRLKTLESWELSLALGTDGGSRRYVGTRYHYGDAYAELIKRQAATPRVYPAMVDGEPVLLSRERLDQLRREMGALTFAAQMMLDPKGDDSVGFKREWRRSYGGTVVGNTYVIADPANSKKKGSDYTAIWAVTAGEDRNWYVRDLIYRRMQLTERLRAYVEMHRKWQPRGFGIEEYGMMADVQALRAEQERIGYRFDVVSLGGRMSKAERIGRLIPLFEAGRIYMPPTIMRDMGEEGIVDVLGRWWIDEYEAWPYSSHDDGLDALSRIEDADLRVSWPVPVEAMGGWRDAEVETDHFR